MTTSCSIEQLPNELLLYIFEWLPQHGSNLLSATLVCSRWNSLISASSKLMDRLILWIDPPLTDDGRGVSREYYDRLKRSVRHYRNLVIQPEEARSLAVAVLVLRKFGPHLRQLCLLSKDIRLVPCSPMKEFELGLEEGDRTIWEQEIDNLDRCLLPIEECRMDKKPISPVLYEQLCLRQIEEMFYSVTYRYCSQLNKLSVRYWIFSQYNRFQRFSLYEGIYMEHLKELEIDQGGLHLVLAKSTSLRKLQLSYVTAGPPFYASLGHTFPMLTYLAIKSNDTFDDSCLWAVSQHCSQLEGLKFSSMKITRHGFRYIHQLQQLKKLDILLSMNYTADAFDVFESLPLESLSINCYKIKLETIIRMLEINVNLKQLFINAQRYTYNGREVSPFLFLLELRAMRPTCEINF